MSFTRANAGGWAVADELTSAQINVVDANAAGGLDKSSAGDTLSGRVVLSAAGRVVPNVQACTDAATAVSVGTYNEIEFTSTITANRSYTLQNAGATSGDTMVFFCDTTLAYEIAVKNFAGTTLFTVGHTSTSDGPWCECKFIGGAWVASSRPPPKMKSQLFTTTGSTWVAPATTSRILVQGVGNGGSGGGGGGGDVADGGFGGYGGGAQAYLREVSVTGGATYTITIPAAAAVGTGGAVGANGTAGTAGGNVTFTGSGVALSFPGGAGGGLGTGAVGSSPGVDGASGTSQLAGGTGAGASGWVGSVGGAAGSAGTSGVAGGSGGSGSLGAGGGGGGQGNGIGGFAETESAGGNGGAGGPGAVVVFWTA